MTVAAAAASEAPAVATSLRETVAVSIGTVAAIAMETGTVAEVAAIGMETVTVAATGRGWVSRAECSYTCRYGDRDRGGSARDRLQEAPKERPKLALAPRTAAKVEVGQH